MDLITGFIIKIEEQYPISKNSEIKVEDLSYTKENATVDEPSGKVTWVIALHRMPVLSFLLVIR